MFLQMDGWIDKHISHNTFKREPEKVTCKWLTILFHYFIAYLYLFLFLLQVVIFIQTTSVYKINLIQLIQWFKQPNLLIYKTSLNDSLAIQWNLTKNDKSVDAWFSEPLGKLSYIYFYFKSNITNTFNWTQIRSRTRFAYSLVLEECECGLHLPFCDVLYEQRSHTLYQCPNT